MPPAFFEAALSPSTVTASAAIVIVAGMVVCVLALSVMLCGGGKKEEQPEDKPSPSEPPKEEAPASAPAPPKESLLPMDKSAKGPEKSQMGGDASVMMKQAQEFELMSKIGGASQRYNVGGVSPKKGEQLPSLRLMDQSTVGKPKSIWAASSKSVTVASKSAKGANTSVISGGKK